MQPGWKCLRLADGSGPAGEHPERRLESIVGFRPIAQDPPADTHHQRPEPANQMGERSLVPSSRESGQGLRVRSGIERRGQPVKNRSDHFRRQCGQGKLQKSPLPLFKCLTGRLAGQKLQQHRQLDGRFRSLSRNSGRRLASKDCCRRGRRPLDADALVAAQVEADRVTVVTTNSRHIGRRVAVLSWPLCWATARTQSRRFFSAFLWPSTMFLFHFHCERLRE